MVKLIVTLSALWNVWLYCLTSNIRLASLTDLIKPWGASPPCRTAETSEWHTQTHMEIIKPELYENKSDLNYYWVVCEQWHGKVEYNIQRKISTVLAEFKEGKYSILTSWLAEIMSSMPQNASATFPTALEQLIKSSSLLVQYH